MRLTCWPLDYKIICADLLSLRAHSDAGTDAANNYATIMSSAIIKIRKFTLKKKISRSKNPQLNLKSPQSQKRICPLTTGAGYFLSEQNCGGWGWTSIIYGAVEVKRGLSDSCRFSQHPTARRRRDPSPGCRSGSAVCLH